MKLCVLAGRANLVAAASRDQSSDSRLQVITAFKSLFRFGVEAHKVEGRLGVWFLGLYTDSAWRMPLASWCRVYWAERSLSGTASLLEGILLAVQGVALHASTRGVIDNT